MGGMHNQSPSWCSEECLSYLLLMKLVRHLSQWLTLNAILEARSFRQYSAYAAQLLICVCNSRPHYTGEQ